MDVVRASVGHGDCLRFLRQTVADNSIDSIITDPPYGLCFMGKDWDKQLPDPAIWAECLRVAKPGAFLLAFGGTRTFHRLACHIEDAGWVLRDCLCWLYGTGFPKGMDISKAIDEVLGAVRKTQKSPARPATSGGFCGKSQTQAWIERSREVGFHEYAGPIPVTVEAQEWQGWNAALKPAWEPIIVAMKPSEGTFAANALKHGVAGLNIDGCRVGSFEASRPSALCWGENYGKRQEVAIPSPSAPGRYPANLLLDSEAAAMLDAQAGEAGGRENSDRYVTRRAPNRAGHMPGIREAGKQTLIRAYSGRGGPSRFFYCSKPSAAERGVSRHPTQKPLALMRWLCRLTRTPTGGVVLDPFMGSGTTGVAALLERRDFAGFEQDKESFETARRRLRDWRESAKANDRGVWEREARLAERWL